MPPSSSTACAARQPLAKIERDGQIGGILGAFDAANRELWRLRVYENVRIPGLEGDVQDVYFQSMSVDGSKLLIENENGEGHNDAAGLLAAFCIVAVLRESRLNLTEAADGKPPSRFENPQDDICLQSCCIAFATKAARSRQ